jgi:hypothetical protein
LGANSCTTNSKYSDSLPGRISHVINNLTIEIGAKGLPILGGRQTAPLPYPFLAT